MNVATVTDDSIMFPDIISLLNCLLKFIELFYQNLGTVVQALGDQ